MNRMVACGAELIQMGNLSGSAAKAVSTVLRSSKTEPRTLLRGGRAAEEALRPERVTRDKVLAVICAVGIHSEKA